MPRIIRQSLSGALLIFFALSLSAPFAVSAGPPALQEGALGKEAQFGQFLNKLGVDDTNKPAEPGTIIQRVVAIVFSFLGIIAVIVMIYAGFLWLTAHGEEEQAKQGKTLLFQAFIGALIILASYSVVYFVLYQLTLSISP